MKLEIFGLQQGTEISEVKQFTKTIQTSIECSPRVIKV